MDDLDLRRLRYFVVVADTLSFVRAARLLYMTQPALSRQIVALERSLGVRLFERSRQGTRLTGPGELLQDGAREILDSVTRLQRTVRTAGRTRGQFTVGFMPGVDAAALLREFRRQHPDLDVSAIFTSVTEQSEFIADGRVDIAFVRLPLRAGSFDVVRLFDEAVVAAVSAADPLAGRAVVRLDDLIDPLQVVDRGDAAAGDSTGGRRPALTVEEVLVEVGVSGRHALLPAGIAAHYTDPEIIYLPVDDAPSVAVGLAYDGRRVMPHLPTFVALCRRQLGPLAPSNIDLDATSGRR